MLEGKIEKKLHWAQGSGEINVAVAINQGVRKKKKGSAVGAGRP